MSETPVPNDDPAEAINDALIQFVQCIRGALPDVCSVGLTLGDSYVPFEPDPEDECEADESACEQAWVRVTGVQPAPNTPEGWDGDCALILQMGLEVGVLRCIEIEADGEAPSAVEVLLNATQSMTDMQAIMCAALGCEVWESIEVGTWTPIGPLGGQYGGMWSFTVEPKS